MLTVGIFDNVAAEQDYDALEGHFSKHYQAFMAKFQANATAPQL